MIVEIKRSGFIQRLGFDEFERRVRNGEIPPDTFIRFDPVTGVEFRPAGDLEFFQEAADPDRLAFRKNLTRMGLPIVTALMVGMQARVFFWGSTPDRRNFLMEHFANWGPAAFEQAEVWRLLTYSLLHADLPHILMNVCFLAYMGYHLERAMGHRNTAVIYLGSVFAGGLLSLLMSPKQYSLGSSGGVWGLFGATIVLGWKYWEEIPAASRKYFGWALTPYLIWSAMSGIRDAESIDNWCHFGGLVGGALLATVLDPAALRRRARANLSWMIGVFAAVGATMLILIFAGSWIVPLEVDDDGSWKVSRPGYWQAGWTLTGDRGYFSPTLQANVSVTRTTHPDPLTPADAVDALVTRISSGSRDATVMSREPWSADGVPGERLTMRFRRSESNQTVDAAVFVRGRTEFRLVVQTDDDFRRRYQPLVHRMVDSVEIGPDPDVERAKQRVTNHPRSWKSAVRLGDAQRAVGDTAAAVDAYRQALVLSPGEPAALVGWTRTCREYQDPPDLGCAAMVETALTAAGDHPNVLVSVAELLESRGETVRAVEVLDRGWAILPGDRTLRRARKKMGLSIEIPVSTFEP